uniref:Histone H1.8 n=1 Tax=Sciurus vulgaris TaxID=55149 RepID=A0A8D2DE50_SCIVU
MFSFLLGPHLGGEFPSDVSPSSLYQFQQALGCCCFFLLTSVPRGLEGRRKPPMLRMVLEALQAGEQRRGTSVAAIKLYILHRYPPADAARFKYLLKQALATGLRRGLLARPAHSRARGATGSFKLVPKHKRKIQPRKRPVPKVPRKAAEALGKGAKKPSQAQKEAARSGRVEKAAPRPGAASQKVPKRGREAKDTEASKPPQKPAKATRAPSSAVGVGEKAKVKAKRSRQGAEACGKSKAKGASSKPAEKQVKNGVASPAKRKMAAQAPKERAGQGAGQRPRTKAAAVAQKGDRAKAVPTALARKTEAPEGPRKPGLPTKSSSSKAPSKKVEAKS